LFPKERGRSETFVAARRRWGGGLHTPTEWIELASLVERCQLLAILIARLCRNGFSA
jgi:acetylornithine deacetylase/succinyl-diaminopimelate desuccinylase-like protein